MQTKIIKKTKSTILLLYIVTFVFVSLIKKLSIGWLLLSYTVLTLILVVLFWPSIVGLIGNYFYATKDFNKAEKYLTKSMDKKTIQPTVYLNYAIILLNKGDYKNALIYLDKAKEINSKSITDMNITLTIGGCYLVAKKYDLAIKELEELKNQYSSGRENTLRLLSFAYYKNGDIEKALENINLSLEKDPNSEVSYEIKGILHFKENDIVKAKENLTNALSINQDLVDGNFFMGLVYEKEGDLDKAKACLEYALKCDITKLNFVTKEDIRNKLRAYPN